MIPLTLGEIAAVTRGRVHPAEAAGTVVTGSVVTDSREVEPGSLYVARLGEHADGHDFTGAAAGNGAVAALTSRPVDDLPCVVVEHVPDGSRYDAVTEAFGALAHEVVERCAAAGGLEVIGITGSSGKTSTKDLAAQVVARLGPTVAPIASYNSEVGVPLTVCRLQTSTAYLVAEMGASGSGHIAHLTAIAPPRIGVVLNVGTAHLGEFGSREAIARAKAELVQALPPEGLAVLNADDPVVAAMAGQTQARVVLVGRGPQAQVRADDVRLGPRGQAAFLLTVPGSDPVPVQLQVHGEHQVGNALSVAAVAVELGMPVPQIAQALAAAGRVSRWRMEVHERADGVVVVNDAYNANPDSMAAALRSLIGMRGGGRAVAVIGEMLELGPDGPGEHERAGRLAAELGVDIVVSVGEGARAAAVGFAAESGESYPTADVEAAERLLADLLRTGDTVLVKSSNGSGLGRLGDALAGVGVAEVSA